MAPSPNPAPSFPDSASGLSHYAELKLSRAATSQELHQAFRQLSKLYHPDTTQLPPQQAESAFARLQLAYATLSDPARRRAYDQQLDLGAAPCLAACCKARVTGGTRPQGFGAPCPLGRRMVSPFAVGSGFGPEPGAWSWRGLGPGPGPGNPTQLVGGWG